MMKICAVPPATTTIPITDENLRCSARNNNNPDNRNHNIGFRLLLGANHAQFRHSKVPGPDVPLSRNRELRFGHDMRLFLPGDNPVIAG
jgi:hypothetical protein